MDSQTDNFLTDKSIIAVVGVSSAPEKYGNKVFFDLLNKGYRVYAIHPDGGEIQGNPRYANLSSLPEKPTLVVSVVPPKTTEKIILECVKLDIDKIWMQPGSESQAAIELCRKNKIKYLANACIIIQSIKK
jgi:hypothetical protein